VDLLNAEGGESVVILSSFVTALTKLKRDQTIICVGSNIHLPYLVSSAHFFSWVSSVRSNTSV
jgi:hypothetical protein